MANLMDLYCDEDTTQEELIEQVFDKMWCYNQTYSICGPSATTEDSVPVWYIMDEFGSRIQHSSDPSFRVVPFYYLHDRAAYGVLFPVKDVEFEGEVTRNYAEGPPCDALTQKALLVPWEPCDMTDVNCNQKEPDEEFLRSGRKEESLPDLSATSVLPGKKLKVYSEYAYINKYLSHPSFELVSSEDAADVLWLNYHFKNYRELSIDTPHKIVNQFPFEHVITVKDLLAIICRRVAQDGKTVEPDTLETIPKWLPTTYNLKTELSQFVSYFQQREKRKLDNYWICKPWNLARSLDIHITNNLNYILRLPATGPKIACKYLTEPVLFPRQEIGLVKFDFRYIILLRSIAPLKVFVYRHFWLRFSNRPFSLDDLDDYEKHFTVMNYAPDANLRQMYCNEFIEIFNRTYPEFPWESVEKDVFRVIKLIFEMASSKSPPAGICPNPQSRAMYAIDMMIEWDRGNEGHLGIQPKVLEINWCPDCQRACQYYPDFFNDIFSALFLDEFDNKNAVLL